MIWKRIPKEESKKPKNGKTYHDWKEFLAEEGFYQCVYCAIHENHFGGMRNFHVEHYRPKSHDSFKKLENDLNNLFYACSICNCFKGSRWDQEPDEEFKNFAFPDPSKVDYSDLFDVDFISGLINPKNATSKFLINRLFLNRPQLLMERRNFSLSKGLDDVLEEVQVNEERLFKLATDGNLEALDLIKKSSSTIQRILKLLNAEKTIRPYSEPDIKRKS